MIYNSHYARKLFELITTMELKRENMQHVKNMREEYRMIMNLNVSDSNRHYKPRPSKNKLNWKPIKTIVNA